MYIGNSDKETKVCRQDNLLCVLPKSPAKTTSEIYNVSSQKGCVAFRHRSIWLSHSFLTNSQFDVYMVQQSVKTGKFNRTIWHWKGPVAMVPGVSVFSQFISIYTMGTNIYWLGLTTTSENKPTLVWTMGSLKTPRSSSENKTQVRKRHGWHGLIANPWC